MAKPGVYSESFIAFLDDHPELDELSDRVLDELVESGEIAFFTDDDGEGGDS